MSAAPALTAAASGVPIYVVSDSQAEGLFVKSLLDDDFKQVRLWIDTEVAADISRLPGPAVFVAAFKDFLKAEQFWEQRLRSGCANPLRSDRLVALCTKESVGRAYQLCRMRAADDYVLFWPLTFDTARLRLAVHRATEALSRPIEASIESTITSQELRIEELEAALCEWGETQKQAAAALAGEMAPTAGNAFTVLVVDDEELQQKITGRVLESAGYRVKFATTGGAALNMLRAMSVDLILMDLQMPQMNGLELACRLRSEPRFAGIPIVMLTGTADREVVMRSLRLGVADFVVKPFNRAHLISKLGRILRPSLH